MSNLIQLLPFSRIDLDDPFFDTLKSDYPGFDKWYAKKAASGDKAYVLFDDLNQVGGFLYLKVEEDAVTDVSPPLVPARRLKVGTFKIDAHGTKLGDRFFKKIFDEAFALRVEEVYVTIFAKHEGLSRLFDRFGFTKVAEKPSSIGDVEQVLLRDLKQHSGHLLKDYPFVHTTTHRKFLLSIYPEWHTQLLPDSILKTEKFDSVHDLSHTNSIRKVYICFMPGVDVLQPGDILVLYRTKPQDQSGSAEYLSVATSIGVVAETKRATDFPTVEEFIRYCGPFSVFNEDQLKDYYRDRSRTRIIKFTYNAAMTRRLIRKRLIEEVGLSRNVRWGFFELTDQQFRAILNLGGVNEDLIVD